MNKPEEFVRNSDDKQRDATYPLAKAFSCAWCGITHSFRTQRNMKIHLCVAVVAIVLGFVLRIDLPSWMAVIICIGFVMGLECVNTALEAVVDLVTSEYSELARIAKDCAAGAVFIEAITSIVIAFLVYVPAFINLVEGVA
ncbi:MAG: diacylglycerol kinase family protein [Eggerthellaceae bacterium]|nr:diacylglycerol kinase family protein [Eggerthellaceae bacterium]